MNEQSETTTFCLKQKTNAKHSNVFEKQSSFIKFLFFFAASE